MSNNRQDEKIERIRKLIMKSGFPAEIEIGNVLRRNHWIVINQFPYTDPVSNKTRTIDVSGFMPAPIAKLNGFQIIVECKKSEQHDWVFHTQHKTGEYYTALISVLQLFQTIGHPAVKEKLLSIANENKTDPFSINRLGNQNAMGSKMSLLAKLHNFNENIRMGIMHLIPDKNDDFFEAKQQIISILKSNGQSKSSYVQFPVIVFDGEIFEFYQENNEMRVNPINQLQCVAYDNELPLCTIDIVRKSYFEEYLKTIENDIAIYRAICSSN